jgi:hypothetical protein
MIDYMVEAFNIDNKKFNFKVCSVDGYCAELEVRKKFPTYRIGEVVRLKNLYEPYEDYTDDELRTIGDNH